MCTTRKIRIILKRKRQLAKNYENFFEGKKIKFRKETKNTKANYWLNSIELENLEERELFLVPQIIVT